jgi:hypothetical protein
MKNETFGRPDLAWALLLGISLVGAVAAQQKVPRISTEAELTEDLNLGPCKNSERLEAVKKLFLRMGAAEADIKAEKVKDIQNVYVTRNGKTAQTVVIGAHYDKVSSGCGIIDNWSGIVILAHLFRTLADSDIQKTYIFAAFDREEEGLKGSAAMVKAIPKEERSGYCWTASGSVIRSSLRMLQAPRWSSSQRTLAPN